MERPDQRSRLQAQLQRGFHFLCFEPALESAYREDQFQGGLRHLRINLAVLIVLVFAIVQVDRVVIPTFSTSVPDVTRLGVMVPILAIGLALTFLRGAAVWYPRVMAALMAIALMGIAWIGLFAWSLGENRVFVRLIIATIAVYFVIGLRFRLALVANVMAVVFYAVAAAAWTLPTMVLAEFLAMLLLASMICAAGAYNLEHARRTAWLEGQLLAELALLDGLTGIPNRRRLDEHLQRVWQLCLREQRPVALLFLDLDSFKAFNDRHGHQAGDEALTSVAWVFARYGRRPLDLAARFGGEEFAIVLFDTGREAAMQIGEEILEAVRGLGIARAQPSTAPVLTTSIGIACVVPTATGTCADLLQLADRALFEAKGGGGNNVRVLV